jgi:hypothetical protein
MINSGVSTEREEQHHISARGAGLELAHLELMARPIDASIPLRRDDVQQI